MLAYISDKADGSAHVSFEEFQQEAAKNSAHLVQHMLEKWEGENVVRCQSL